MEQPNLNVLEELPANRAIYKLALPTMAGMIVMILYNLTDTFFIGKLNDADQVAAISIALPFFMMMMAFGGIFGNGGASYISRLLGENKEEAAKKTLSTAIISCGLFSIFLTFIGFLCITPLLKMAGASENTLGYAYSYTAIIVGGNLLVTLNFAMSQIVRSEGAAKEAMSGMMIGTITNIILDPIFILAMDMGVAGAAVATLIGNACGLAYYFFFYLKGKSTLTISFKNFSLERKIHSEIWKIGIPASLNHILMSVSFAFCYSIAATYGDNVVAAFGINMRVMQIPVFLVIGLSIGIQPLIGYNFGSRNLPRMNEIIKLATLYSTGIAVFFTIIFFIFPAQLITVFIQDKAVVDVGVTVLYAMAVSAPFLGVQMVLMNAMLAMGKGMPSLTISVSRQGLIYIPAIIILNTIFQFHGFIFAQAVADVFTTAISLVFYHRIYSGLKKDPRFNIGSIEDKNPKHDSFINKLKESGGDPELEPSRLKDAV